MTDRSPLRLQRCLGVVFALLFAAHTYGDSRAQCEQQFDPQSGQPGKDVVWVPTSDALVMRMLQLAEVKPTDFVYDLGAGDGKIAIAAAKHFGARSVGVEYNPDMVKLAQCYARAEGVADRARIIQGDIFETDFSDATVVTLYLLPDLNLRLRPTLLKMKPGTRIVSHSFLMDDWEPDDRTTEEGHAYLWIVPADVSGTWEFQPQGGEGAPLRVRFEQKFQELTGAVNDRKEAVRDGKVRGSQVQFSFEDKAGAAKVTGELKGDRIEARVDRDGKMVNYTGRRV